MALNDLNFKHVTESLDSRLDNIEEYLFLFDDQLGY